MGYILDAVDLRVGVQLIHALNVHNDVLVTRLFEGKMAEGLMGTRGNKIKLQPINSHIYSLNSSLFVTPPGLSINTCPPMFKNRMSPPYTIEWLPLRQQTSDRGTHGVRVT